MAAPTTGLCFEVEGDVGLTGSGTMAGWTNQAALGSNPGLLPRGGSEPQVGVDTLDGVPGLTFPLGASTQIAVDLNSGSGAVGLKDRTGALFGYGPGERQERTIVSVFRPDFDPGSGVLGGCIVRFGTTPGGGEQDFEAFFRCQDLPGPIGADAFALFANDWPNHFELGCYAPDTPSGAGNIYNGVPMVLIFKSSGFPDLRVSINFGPEITLTPATMPAATSGHPIQNSFSFGGVIQAASVYDRMFGAFFATYVYDWDIDGQTTHDLAVHIDGKFPSIGITIPTFGISGTQSFSWPITQPSPNAISTAPLRAGLLDPLGNGILRPFRRTVHADFATASGIPLVKSDLGQLLGTPIRTLPWRHDFGADLQPLRHKNNTEILGELARTRVESAIRKYARNVELRSVRAERVALPGTGHQKNTLILWITVVIGGRTETLRVPV